MRRMTPAQFRAAGFLQELNRQFLHPLGMALEHVLLEDGTEAFGDVWDCREDPVGLLFSPGEMDDAFLSKASSVLRHARSMARQRERELGWVVQPLPPGPNTEPRDGKPFRDSGMKIYIAGPYTKGDVAANVRRAIYAADEVTARGHVPFIPHLTHFWHMIAPRGYEFWLSYDMEWLKVCDAVLRLPGESAGADKEVAWAEANGLPVYRSVFELPEAR